MTPPNRIARNLLCLSAATLLALPAAAQQVPDPVASPAPARSPAVTTLPGVTPERFTLGTPTPVPVTVPSPVPSPTPTAAARSTPAPRATASSQPRPAPQATAAPPAEPTPSASATTSAAATPAPQPAPSPDAAAPIPAAQTASATPAWLWVLVGVGITLLAVGAFLLLRRRRHAEPEAEADVAPVRVLEPVPAPVPAPAPPRPAPPLPVPAPAAVAPPGDAPFDIAIVPRRVAVDPDQAVLEIDLAIANLLPHAAENVRIDITMISASPDQDRYLAAYHASRILPEVVPPFDLAPGAAQRLTATLTLPRDQLNIVEVGGRPMFVPLVMVDLRWRSGITIRRFGADFMAGVAGQGGKLGPIWLDRPQQAARLATTRYVPRPV